MEIDWCIGSTAVDAPVKSQNDAIMLATNLAASRLHEIWREDVFRLQYKQYAMNIIIIHNQILVSAVRLWHSPLGKFRRLFGLM